MQTFLPHPNDECAYTYIRNTHGFNQIIADQASLAPVAPVRNHKYIKHLLFNPRIFAAF